MKNETKYRKLSELTRLEGNPRKIKEKHMQKLVQSIKDNPEYFEARPVILSDRTGELVIIAGNQRYEAAKRLGLKEIPTFLISGLTEEKEQEIVIRDNVSNGEFDFEILEDWDADLLEFWGVDMPKKNETDGMPEDGEVEFAEELLLEHNYIVLYFDNPLDWEVAKDKFGLKQTKSGIKTKKSQKVGIGRVVRGADILSRL